MGEFISLQSIGQSPQESRWDYLLAGRIERPLNYDEDVLAVAVLKKIKPPIQSLFPWICYGIVIRKLY
ncbi:MAG: hypothetical protein CMC22_04830 [Flavobacteriaceae bacterium]|nr:hypothetical protein [Flavobacteriaceae bacterium]